MNMRRILILLIVLAVAGVVQVQSQTGGQFCVRAFEDRNGNGQLDAGEPLLTHGIGAQLLDAEGVIIASALLDNSPTATQGVICFTGLAFGQYTMTVTSAEYSAITQDTMTVAINPGELPTVFEFAGQRAVTQDTAGTAATTPQQDTNVLLERVVIAALAALAVIAVMAVLGTIIYLLTFRGRARQAITEPYMGTRTSTGSHPAVRPTDSGEYPKA